MFLWIFFSFSLLGIDKEDSLEEEIGEFLGFILYDELLELIVIE